MMDGWITVTGRKNGAKIPVRASQINYIPVEVGVTTVGGHGFRFQVKESPKDILKAIEAAKPIPKKAAKKAGKVGVW